MANIYSKPSDNYSVVIKKEKNIRVAWIDWAKMVLIYLMVVGHFHPPLVQSKFFYVFHMPAFFIISGYLYRPHDWRRTIVSLMMPVVVFSVFNLFFQILIALLKTGSYDYSDLLRRTLVPFVGGNSEPNVDYIILFMGTWFPIVLMLIRLLVGDIKCFAVVYRHKVTAFLLVVAFMITLPFWANMKGEICQLKPFLLFPSFPFFLLGSMLHDVDAHKLKVWLYRLLPLFSALYLTMAVWNGRVGILNLHFGHNYFFFFVGAVSGSAVLFWLCGYMKACRYVETISVGTMLILGLHMDFYDVLFPIVNRLGLYSVLPDWAVVWAVSALTLLLCYWPIRFCMRHAPILLGKFSVFNN